MVMPALQCSPKPGLVKGASAQLAHMGTRAAEHGGMLGSNCEVCDLSPTSEVWDSDRELIRP